MSQTETNLSAKKGPSIVKRVKQFFLKPLWWIAKKVYRFCFSTLDRALVCLAIPTLIWVWDHFFFDDKFYTGVWAVAKEVLVILTIIIFVFFCGMIGDKYDQAKKKAREEERARRELWRSRNTI